MKYNGTPDVGVVSPEETIEQISRQLNVPAAVYQDESDIPPCPDESNVQVATLDDHSVLAIPLYKEEAQAYLPTHQFLQQNQVEGLASILPPSVSTPSTPVPAPATPTAGNLNFAWAPGQPLAQPPAPSGAIAAAQSLVGSSGLNFNVSALAQSISGLVPNAVSNAGYNNQQTGFNNQPPFNNQAGFNNQPAFNSQPAFNHQPVYNNPLGYNAQYGYNPQTGYNNPPPYNPQPAYNDGRGFNPPRGFSPPGNAQRRGGPHMNPDRRNAAEREVCRAFLPTTPVGD